MAQRRGPTISGIEKYYIGAKNFWRGEKIFFDRKCCARRVGIVNECQREEEPLVI